MKINFEKLNRYFLKKLKTDTSKVLSGNQKGVHVRIINSIPIFRVELIETSATFAVKRSNLDASLLQKQLLFASEMRNKGMKIPRNFGFCKDHSGISYEIWEWLDNKDQEVRSRQFQVEDLVENYFLDFIRISNTLKYLQQDIYPNDFQIISENTFNSDFFSTSKLDEISDLNLKKILSEAIHIWKDRDFREEIKNIPRSFIHTDIRADNIHSQLLIDFSNSKIDMRILEVARFININYQATHLVQKYAFSPRLSFDYLAKGITEQEIRLFKSIVIIDFACIYNWSKHELLRRGTRSKWALEYIKKAPGHISKCFDLN